MRYGTTAVLVGLGTARLIETLKEALPVVPTPPWKSTAATVVAGGAAACLTPGDWRLRVSVAAGAAGIAMLAHELRQLLSVLADRQKLHVLRATRH